MQSTLLHPVAPSDVLLATHNSKPKLSQGYDGISTKLLKETISNILQPITHILNRSFTNGNFPQDLKILWPKSSAKLQTNKLTISLFQNIREIMFKTFIIFGTHFIQASIQLSSQAFNYTPNHSASKLLCRI